MKHALIYAFILFTALFTALASSLAQTAEKPVLHWGTLDFAPSHIVRGPDKGTGKVDNIVALLKARMPEYDHREVVVNTKRIDHEIRLGKNYCGTTAIKTPEREKFAVFSVPDDFVPSHRILMKKSQRGRFPSADTVNLEKILSDSNLRGAFAHGRSYTAAVDDILAKHENDKHLYFYTGSSINEGPLNLWIASRVDYILEYPWMAGYKARQQGFTDRFEAIALTELKPYVFGHVYCPNNEWGVNVVKKVNEILLEMKGTQEYRAIIETNMDHSSRDFIRAHYDSIFLHAK